MLYIEISKKCNDFNIWTDERIKKAFNRGKGTFEDFKRYMNDNKVYCEFITNQNDVYDYLNKNT